MTSILLSLLLVPPPAGLDTRPMLDAIRTVETGGHADPANAVGDGGRALGYQSVRDQATAERVVLAYLTRYAPDWSLRTCARIHNGGPKGHRKPATLGYAKRVEEVTK